MNEYSTRRLRKLVVATVAASVSVGVIMTPANADKGRGRHDDDTVSSTPSTSPSSTPSTSPSVSVTTSRVVVSVPTSRVSVSVPSSIAPVNTEPGRTVATIDDHHRNRRGRGGR
jgi:hypothetical protein